MINKLVYGFLALILVLFTACKKDTVEPTLEELQNQIRDYIQKNSVSAQQTTSGIYYQKLFTISSGRNPTKGDLVFLSLKGTYLDGATIPNSTGLLKLPIGGKAANGENYLLKEFEDVLLLTFPLDSIRVFLPTNPVQTYFYKVLWVRSEIEQINKIKTDSSWTTTTTASGLQYLISTPGSGDTPSASSSVKVRYTLRDLSGTVLDKSDAVGANFNLSGQLIAGFKEAVQLLKEGGRGKFLLPSSIAYGDTQTASGAILPFTVLYFDIELIEAN
jgi:FKBP-type peptidyl-prolyl cis-trans isomerase FkpA